MELRSLDSQVLCSAVLRVLRTPLYTFALAPSMFYGMCQLAPVLWAAVLEVAQEQQGSPQHRQLSWFTGPSPVLISWDSPGKVVLRGGISTPEVTSSPHPQGQGQGERLRFVHDKVPLGVAPTLGWSILAAPLRLVPGLCLGQVLGLASQL